MTKTEFGQIIGVLTNLGVIAGLIFVGMQYRLDRQLASSEGTYAANADRTAWAQIVTDNADVWVRGLADESLSAVEAAQFNAMAEAYLFAYFTRWSRADDAISGQTPARFAIEVAIELHKYPGLLRFWRERQSAREEIRLRLGEGSGTYGAAVNAELNRLHKEASTH